MSIHRQPVNHWERVRKCIADIQAEVSKAETHLMNLNVGDRAWKVLASLNAIENSACEAQGGMVNLQEIERRDDR